MPENNKFNPQHSSDPSTITINYNLLQNDHHQQQTFISNELIAKSFAKYYPEEANFWMYAMIVLGLAFIIFVAITIYKLCQPEKNTRYKQLSGSVPGIGTGPTTIVT